MSFKLIINQLTSALIIFSLGALVLEFIKEGIVSNVIDLHWILMLTVVILIINNLFSKKDPNAVKTGSTKWRPVHIWIIGCFFAIISAVLINFKTAELGSSKWLVTISVFIIIIITTKTFSDYIPIKPSS